MLLITAAFSIANLLASFIVPDLLRQYTTPSDAHGAKPWQSRVSLVTSAPQPAKGGAGGLPPRKRYWRRSRPSFRSTFPLSSTSAARRQAGSAGAPRKR